MNNIIKRKWSQNSMVIIEDLQGMAFQAESGGHTFQISGIDGEGNAVALSGTPAGVMLRSDGQDVPLTCSVSGGVVFATLPANAYVVPGRFGLTIFLTSDGQKTAIYAAVGTVGKTSSGTVAPPAGSDVVDLVNAIAAAVATIPASYTDLMAAMAPTYSSSGLYAVGSYAWYSGKLYRCTTAITSGETWTSGHWTLANLGSDLVDLKSAFGYITGMTNPVYKIWNTTQGGDISGYIDISANANDKIQVLVAGTGKTSGAVAFAVKYAGDSTYTSLGVVNINELTTIQLTNAITSANIYQRNATAGEIMFAIGKSYADIGLQNTISKVKQELTDDITPLRISIDDKGILLTNGYIDNYGTYSQNNSNVCTGYLSAKEIQKIIVFDSSITLRVHIYNSSKQQLKMYGRTYGTAPWDFVIPQIENAVYVRICINESDIDDFTDDIAIVYGSPVDAIIPPTWEFGGILEDGSFIYNENYSISSPIPYNLVKSITNKIADTTVINCNVFNSSMTHLEMIKNIKGKYDMPFIQDAAYIRIWTACSKIDEIYNRVYIEYGTNNHEFTENILAMPSKMYMLNDIEYDLFKDNMVKDKGNTCYRIDADSYNSTIAQNTDRAVYIKKPQNLPNNKLIAKVYSKKTGDLIGSKNINVVVSDPTDSTSVKVQIIGDSFTAMSPSWVDYIFAQNLCPSVQFVGLRENLTYESQYHEGRSGWSMQKYADPAVGTGLDGNNYSGFSQPNGDYKYWGDIRFWVNAKNPTSHELLVGGFDTSKFDSNGYLINPTTNDIMHDANNFIKWDGTQWVTVQYSDYTWSFQYAKYQSMWNIPSPDICAIMIGVNDFRTSFTQQLWNTYKQRLNALIASYQSAVPSGKFVIVIHCSNMGYSWNVSNEMPDSAELENLNMWKYRNAIIDEYDNKESDGIYLCDAGIMVDGKYGYETEEIKPFSTYTGDEMITVQKKNPHPTLAFSAMSLPFAAIIQYLRAN